MAGYSSFSVLAAFLRETTFVRPTEIKSLGSGIVIDSGNLNSCEKIAHMQFMHAIFGARFAT